MVTARISSALVLAMAFYRRNLPHWHPEGASIFLTWRLYGSLPVDARSTARIGCATRSSWQSTAVEERKGKSAAMQEGKSKSTARIGCATKPSDSPGRAFRLVDSVLDRADKGPLWLKDPRIARCVMEAIHLGEKKLGFYSLHAFVIMPNHIHLLITPGVPVSRVMNGLKGITAREANCILNRKGQHFWQDESFDQWVRSSAEFDRVQAYIERNPVTPSSLLEPRHGHGPARLV